LPKDPNCCYNSKVKKIFKRIKKLPTKYKIPAYTAIAIGVLYFGSFGIYFKYYGTLPDALSNLLTEIPTASKDERILIFSPHPDDETIGAAGYTKKAIENGAVVKIVCVTDGNKHNLKELRYQEIQKATKVLGVSEKNLIFYDFPDTKLKDNAQRFKELAKKDIYDFKPTIIISTITADINKDHKETGEIIDDLIRENKDLKITQLGFLVHYPKWPRPEGLYPHRNLLPPVKLMRPEYNWVKFPLDEATIDTKEEAVLQYKSQLKLILPRILLQSSVKKNELFVVK